MVVLETKALRELKKMIENSRELNKNDKNNFLKYIGYLTKDERDYLKLLL